MTLPAKELYIMSGGFNMNQYLNWPQYCGPSYPQNYEQKVHQHMERNNSSKLYNETEALIKGNAFVDLYEGYKNYVPSMPRNMNEKEKMMWNIQANSGMAHDIGLYLDIYSTDQEMIGKFNEYAKKADQAIGAYEMKYGPIDHNFIDEKSWAWNTSTWPWEVI